MAELGKKLDFDAETLRVWRQMAGLAMAMPGRVDSVELGQAMMRLLDAAERLVRAQELSDRLRQAKERASETDIVTLQAVVSNWSGSSDVTIASPDLLRTQISAALEALAIVYGIEGRLVEAGRLMEHVARGSCFHPGERYRLGFIRRGTDYVRDDWTGLEVELVRLSLEDDHWLCRRGDGLVVKFSEERLMASALLRSGA